MVGDREDILVAAAAHIHHDQMIARPGWRDFGDMCQRMGGFECRNDAFEPARQLKCCERLRVGDSYVFDAPDVVQPGMLRSDPRIIETSRNRMGVANLSVRVLQ